MALKVIKAGMDSKQVIARFEAERQALALMDHPNIAKVLDAGATDDGRPYFVMELVKGVPITEYCDAAAADARASGWSCSSRSARPCSTPTRRGSSTATSSRRTCWSTLHDGQPVPKVIDFGVAKATGQQLTEQTLFTGFGQIDRHAGVHEPGAGGAERPRHRHAQRHLLAGRAAVRAADRHDAVRRRDGCKQAALRRDAAGSSARRSRRKPSTRLSSDGRAAGDRGQRGNGAERS